MKKLINPKTNEVAYLDLLTNTIYFSNSKTSHYVSIQNNSNTHLPQKLTAFADPISAPAPKSISNNFHKSSNKITNKSSKHSIKKASNSSTPSNKKSNINKSNNPSKSNTKTSIKTKPSISTPIIKNTSTKTNTHITITKHTTNKKQIIPIIQPKTTPPPTTQYKKSA